MLSFYTDPAFFIILAVIAIPAVALGALGRSLKGYGMAVSALFLVLLFAGSWEVRCAWPGNYVCNAGPV